MQGVGCDEQPVLPVGEFQQHGPNEWPSFQIKAPCGIPVASRKASSCPRTQRKAAEVHHWKCKSGRGRFDDLYSLTFQLIEFSNPPDADDFGEAALTCRDVQWVSQVHGD
jgi:hypothetical protein